jgi:hypothetical protein
MVTVKWIDTIFEKGNTMLLCAYDEEGYLIFEKRLDATKEEAEQTAYNIGELNQNSEFYDYSH